MSKEATNDKKQPLVARAGSWIDDNVLPYVAIGIMILCTGYTATKFVGRINALPEQAQGAIALVAVAFVTSRAVKKLKR